MARYTFTPEMNRVLSERHREAADTRFHYRLEDASELLAAGESPVQVARRLDTTVGALSRQLYRRGHPELARIFSREAKRQRRANQ